MLAKTPVSLLKTFEITFNEKEALTTVKVSVAVDADPYAENVKQLGKNPEMVQKGIKENLAKGGVGREG